MGVRIQDYFEAISDVKIRAAFSSLQKLIVDQQAVIDQQQAAIEDLQDRVDALELAIP